MKVVVDTNILISTLINPNSKIGSLVMKDLRGIADLYACYYLYIELFDKKDRIRKYTKMDEVDLLELLYLVIRKINFINEEQVSEAAWERAHILTHDIDIKDISFVALALDMNAKLWTGDKKLYTGLIEKGFKDVLNTQNLVQLIA